MFISNKNDGTGIEIEVYKIREYLHGDDYRAELFIPKENNFSNEELIEFFDNLNEWYINKDGVYYIQESRIIMSVRCEEIIVRKKYSDVIVKEIPFYCTVMMC